MCKPVKPSGWVLLAGVMLLGGCKTANDVAVSTFRVLDAPANYVRRHIDRPANTPASSDTVTTPGRTVAVAPTREAPPHTTQKPPQPNASAAPRSSPPSVAEKPKPSPSPSRNSSAQPQYPTAKPVPGKPGYVFSPFDPSGGYVDVNGYTSGQKVKDPYSGKIFLVP